MVSQIKEAAVKNRRIQDLILHPAVWITLALIIGAFIGSQAAGPASQRYIKLGLVMIFLYVVVRYPIYIPIGIFMIVYLVPTILWIGNSNILFIFILAVVWAVKFGMRLEDSPRRTFLDGLIFLFVTAHIASLMHVTTTEILLKSFTSLLHLLMPIFVFYMIINVARSSTRLLFLTQMFNLSMAIVLITAILERYFPNIRYLPEWYLKWRSADMFGPEVVRRSMGIFRSHDLLSDACALCVIMQLFMVVYFRHRRWLSLTHALVGALAVFILMMTGNRGGLIALVVGLGYFLFVFGKGIRFGHLLSGIALIVGIIFVTEIVVGSEEGNVTLLSRMTSTTFEGLIPDTRSYIWHYIWDHIMESPLWGHGPYFDTEIYRTSQGRVAWPHNSILFYFLTLGVFGALIYAIFLFRIITKTRPGCGYSLKRVTLAKGLAIVYHINMVQFLVGEMRTDHQRPDVRVNYMWFIYGLAVLSYYLWKKEREEAERRVSLPGR